MNSRRRVPKASASNRTEDGLPATQATIAMTSRHTVPQQEEPGGITAAEGFADRSAITEPPAPVWSLETLLGSTTLVPSFDQFPDPVAIGIFTLQEVDALYELCVTYRQVRKLA